MKSLKTLRKNRKVSQVQLANALHVTQATVSRWESGEVVPTTDYLEQLAEFFGVTTDYLLGRPANTFNFRDTLVPHPKSVMIPVLGTIPAGVPIEAIEDIIEWVDIPEEWTKSGQRYFGLQVTGDSMLPEYRSGDYVILRQQPCCESGAVCAVLVNSQDATLKKVIIRETGMVLQPLNPAFEPLVFTPEQVKRMPVEIKGVVVELRRKF